MESNRKNITFGLSPCPNDTFAFYGLIHGKVETEFGINATFMDVQALNEGVLAGRLEMSKISYHLLGYVQDDYFLLESGSALGWGCGPLLVARKDISVNELRRCRIAIPGIYTTAALLFRLYCPEATRFIPMLFSDIPMAVVQGKADAGVIIHETRFVYERLNLVCLQDLGNWWEQETGLPIPLGGIVAKRNLGAKQVQRLDEAVAASVDYAYSHKDEVMAFVKRHAQETEDDVIEEHIKLYVNPFTKRLGKEGLAAVEHLLQVGRAKGILPAKKGDYPPLTAWQRH